MTLAQSVRSAIGGVLLGRGSVLDARAIGILKSLDVTHVLVEREAHAAPSTEEAMARRAIADREEKRFGDVSGDPYMTALLTAVIELKGSDWESGNSGAGGDAGTAPISSGDGADHA
jgi:hypothetical protein